MGTDSIHIVADSDSATHMVVAAHIESNTSSDTDWVGNVQDDMMFVSVQPEFSPLSLSSMCR